MGNTYLWIHIIIVADKNTKCIYVFTFKSKAFLTLYYGCLLYTSDAADERSSVDLGGRRIFKKKTNKNKKKKCGNYEKKNNKNINR